LTRGAGSFTHEDEVAVPSRKENVVGGYVDKIRPKVGEVMGDSEQLLGAIRTMPRGSTMGIAVGGAVGAVVANRQAKKAQAAHPEESVAARWPQVRSAVALTNQRLLIFDYTFMGKPKDLVGEVPLDQVASLSVDKGVLNKVTFGFTDGSGTQVECAKLEKVGDFVSAFEGTKK
jgi:hypothetical protein